VTDFITVTDAKNGKRIVIVTSAIGAVIADFNVGVTGLIVQGVVMEVREPAEIIHAAMGVPRKRTVIDNRDRPIHELTDEELAVAWKQWCERKNIHSLPVATIIEFELKRRGVTVGEPRE
jgi:hypothetical protein